MALEPGTAVADGDGRFEIRAAAGTYDSLNVMAPSQGSGYNATDLRFEVRAGETTDLGDVVGTD